MSHLVFVYGSLKRGFYNHYVLEKSSAKYRGPFKTKAEYTMLNLGSFPGVVQSGSTRITGEVYEVDTLEYLDHLEGYPNFYDRILIDTRWGPTYMYVLLESVFYKDHDVVESGKWV
jgi:gamma-glutamylcyclotransferase (GGCT)/AIG2-like uncharacterized protein YtfP